MRLRSVFVTIVILLFACKQEQQASSSSETTDTTGTSATAGTAAALTSSGVTGAGAQTIVTVHVTGFCSFIHQTDAQPSNEPMKLALMDARAHSIKHVPIIMYPITEEVSVARPVGTSNGKHYFELLGDVLSFNTLSSSGNTLSYDNSTATDCAPNGSFYFLPHLRDLTKPTKTDPPTLKLADLDSDFAGATPRKLAAVADVTFGKLKTYVNPSPLIVWDFKPEKSADVFHSQAVAQEVQWAFMVDGTSLTISSVPIGAAGGTAPTKLVELQADPVTHTIDVTIANLIVSDVAVLANPTLGKPPQKIDEHFPMYFDYVKGWSAPRPRPDGGIDCTTRMPVRFAAPMWSEKVARHRTLLPSELVIASDRFPRPPVVTIGGLNCGPDQIP